MDFVLDASVAAKWFLPAGGEPLTDEALQLFTGFAQGELRFVVPDLFWVELASAFRKAIRMGRFSQASAELAMADLMDRDLPAYPTAPLLNRAFQIATAHNQSVYDSVYVSLALQTKRDLITADERLVNALAVRFPIKWLGAVS
jgi:predicted nucleic acid-binding protein